VEKGQIMGSVSTDKAELEKIFDRDTLIDAAVEEARLDDFGDDSFIEPLDRWLAALITESDLDPDKVRNLLAAKRYNIDVQRMLVNRLRYVDDLKRHPEILDEEIKDPVIIVGLPRTGSTVLHRLMCRDPQAQFLTYWRNAYPAPLPGWRRDAPDERIELVRTQLELAEQYLPAITQRHAFSIDEPEEEHILFGMTFRSELANGWPYNTPKFMSWAAAQPAQEVYDFFLAMLKYLQWQDGPTSDRGPWFLKGTMHIGAFDAFCRTFPTATIVHTHRNPMRMISSACLNLETQWSYSLNHVDLEVIGQRVLAVWSDHMTRYLADRAALGDSIKIIDVAYRRTISEPLELLRDIYDSRGAALSDETIAAAGEWAERNPQYKFGKKDHSLERYGLTPGDVSKAFAAYLDQFGEFASGGEAN
jgi:hypothetical protein